MMKEEGDVEPINMLREVKLEVVAGYLKCDPERLRRTLRRLSEISAAIEYGPNYQAAAITKAVPLTDAELADYKLGTGDEITELEALYDRQDTR
jgi:hypothetical protein